MQKFINKYAVAVIIFIIFWLGILPFLLTNTLKVLCKNLSHNSNYEIVIEKPKIRMYLLPNAKFKSEHIFIKSKHDLNMIDIKDFNIKIRLLPLISGKLHVNKVYASDLLLSAELSKNIELDKNFISKLENTRVICDSVKIDKYQTKIYSKESKNPIIYKGNDFLFRSKNRYLSLKNDSILTSDNNNSKIYLDMYLPKNNDINKTVFDVKVENLDISPFRIYLKNFLPEDLVSLSGIVNITANKNELNTIMKNVSAIRKDSSQSIIFPKTMNVKSKFSIGRNLVNFSSIEVNSDNIHMSVNGQIRDCLGKTMPTVDLNIVVDKSRVEDFIGIIPGFKVEEFDTFALKKYKFYGDVIGNISVKGRLPEPDIFGRVFVDNGILIRPIPNTTKGATIKLSFTGRYANYDVSVPAGGAEKVWVKGTQEIYNIKYAELTVKSSKNVNLHSAQNVVNPLHEILNFIIGPVPILDIYGTGNIDISVKGNRKNPHVWGGLNFYDTQVNFIEIPDMVLKGADAELTFNDQNAAFKTSKGFVDGKEFSINGVCDLNGKFDFDVKSNNQESAYFYNAIQTSSMIPDFQKMLPKLDKISGLMDFTLKVYGSVKDILDLKINTNAFVKGDVVIKDNSISFQGTDVTKTNGKISVDGQNAKADITAKINDLPMSVSAKIKNNTGDVAVNIPKLNPNFLIKDDSIKTKQLLPFVSINAKYKGDINNIEYEKLDFYAKILESNPLSIIKFNSGEVILAGNKLVVKNLNGFVKEPKNSFKTDLRINDTFSKKPLITGIFKIKIPDLKIFNDIFAENILPENLKNVIKDYEFRSGNIDLSGKVADNRLTFDSDIAGISFSYIPLDLPIDIINGKISVRNGNLRLNKINILADNMPILLDGEVKDISDRCNFDLYVNSKPKQDFIDKYLNKKLIYPIKIKGDIVYSAIFKGVPSLFDVKAKVDMKKNSSVYHYGATIGDIENAIVLNLDTKIADGKNLRIKEFTYDKLIDSQSGRQTKLNMLKAWGGIEINKNNDLSFKDFRIKTSNPTDARIFNIIFGKPNIKQGQFTSDLKISGKMSSPKIFGDFHIFETNIPFMDTNMKNIEFSFKDKIINLYSKGEVLGNDIKVEAVLKNKLSKPYQIEKAVISTKNMNLNQVAVRLKESQVENIAGHDPINDFDLDSIIIDDLKLKADNIELRNIKATNLEAEASLSPQKIFDIKNFVFNIAQGKLSGGYKYNLNNNNLNLKMQAENISADDITWALFDLHNQIYGDLTGVINLSCDGNNFEKCMQTLNGNTIFNVKDGKMPKLGSLEYLLKAGNLVKGGITGLSINSIIDIITPLKTGDFSDIFGSITIKDGIAKNIEITTRGKDLSLFIGGTYNFSNSEAEMEVLGLLSRKISNMLGPVGNVSINTLFNLIPGVDLTKDSSLLDKINKIPGIELSNKAFRKFIAEIKGNINGENYVTSFKWIN